MAAPSGAPIANDEVRRIRAWVRRSISLQYAPKVVIFRENEEVEALGVLWGMLLCNILRCLGPSSLLDTSPEVTSEISIALGDELFIVNAREETEIS